MNNNFHIFLGATVADAAARPLHWVYNEKELKNYIRNKKEITFLKKNRCPFYSIKNGSVSGYNDIGQVMFRTLQAKKNKSKILENFKKNIVKNFGPGSVYWKNLKLRKKYKNIKWKNPIKGPWIHQNILETIQNIKFKKKITGGIKVNESDGFCASLPYFLYDSKISNVKKVIKAVANKKVSEKFAITKLQIINLASRGDKNPVKSFLKKNKKNMYFKEVISNIKKTINDIKSLTLKLLKNTVKLAVIQVHLMELCMQFSHQKITKQQLLKQLKQVGVTVHEQILLVLILLH